MRDVGYSTLAPLTSSHCLSLHWSESDAASRVRPLHTCEGSVAPPHKSNAAAISAQLRKGLKTVGPT